MGLAAVVLVIAVVLAGKATRMYNENPGLYTESSFKNMKAGKVCGIIGLCLSACYLVFLIIYIVIIGAALSSMPWDMHY